MISRPLAGERCDTIHFAYINYYFFFLGFGPGNAASLHLINSVSQAVSGILSPIKKYGIAPGKGAVVYTF